MVLWLVVAWAAGPCGGSFAARAAEPVNPGPAVTTAPRPAIAWEHDYDQALHLALAEGKPLLIDFWATWCGPCKEMEVKLWSRADVTALTRKFVCLRVDVDRDPVTSNRYQNEAIPTVILTDPWGTVLAKREGYGGSNDYIGLLRAIPADFSPVAQWRQRLAADPRDFEALRQAGLGYHRLRLFDTSNEFFERVLDAREAKERPDRRAEAMTLIGWNYLKVHDLKRARKSFDRCLKEVPEHPSLDVTLYGLLAVNLADGHRREAEPLMARLESCCPASPLTGRARQDMTSPIAQAH